MAVTNHVNMVMGYIVFIYCFSLILFWGLQRRASVESIAIVSEPGEPDYWDDMKYLQCCDVANGVRVAFRTYCPTGSS